jgi:hypothetical protein
MLDVMVTIIVIALGGTTVTALEATKQRLRKHQACASDGNKSDELPGLSDRGSNWQRHESIRQYSGGTLKAV